METYNINNTEYILSDDLLNKAPVYSKNCRNGRDIIKKYNIQDCIYSKLVENKWILSDGKSKKYDEIFIKKSFVELIPELKNDNKIMDDKNIELAPEIIYLEDNEKFKDNDGKIIEIETIGKRKID